MIRLRLASIVLTLVVLQFCGYVLADVDKFAITEATTVHREMAIARNTNTGDVLVTWSSAIGNGINEIHASLLKLQDDGSFKVGRDLLVSDKNSVNRYPSVAYDPRENNFLLVWNEIRSANDQNVYARFINSKGKLKGKNIPLLVSSTALDSSAVIVFIPSYANSTAVSADYMVAWSRRFLSYGPTTKEGLYVALLNAKGKIVSEKMVILDSTGTRNSY